jgi:hypothetical protein
MDNLFENQLAAVINEHKNAVYQSKHDDASDILTTTDLRDLQTRCLAAIQRIAGSDSIYYKRAVEINSTRNHPYGHLAEQIGIAKSLLSDIRNGFTQSFEEIIHGEVFGDFLEMAEYLCSNGYKDAAAVIAGSTLEAHLKQLSVKFGIALDVGGKPKKADTLNSELKKANAYSGLDQKNVTAWLGLRNSAAHGDYSDYDSAQVALLISSIRDFITRNPA